MWKHSRTNWICSLHLKSFKCCHVWCHGMTSKKCCIPMSSHLCHVKFMRFFRVRGIHWLCAHSLPCRCHPYSHHQSHTTSLWGHNIHKVSWPHTETAENRPAGTEASAVVRKGVLILRLVHNHTRGKHNHDKGNASRITVYLDWQWACVLAGVPRLALMTVTQWHVCVCLCVSVCTRVWGINIFCPRGCNKSITECK